MDELGFRQRCSDEGWNEPAPKQYPAHDAPEMHSHDFDAMVRIGSGELRLAYPDGVDVLGPGDWCVVPAGTIHSEQTGADGAEGLLATRPAI